MSEDPQWTETDSATYRDIAAYAVPERETQIAITVQLVEMTPPAGPIADVCCGEGLLSAAIMRALPDAQLLAYDGSESMLAATRANAPATAQFQTQLFDIAANDWRQFDQPLRAVVSSLAVHHLDAAGKQKLFGDIHAALIPGGVFVLCDLVAPAGNAARSVSASQWDEETKKRAREIDGTLAGFEAFQKAEWNWFRETEPNGLNQPSTIFEHLDWLKRAGFADVDLHWMKAGHAVMSGWRR